MKSHEDEDYIMQGLPSKSSNQVPALEPAMLDKIASLINDAYMDVTTGSKFKDAVLENVGSRVRDDIKAAVMKQIGSLLVSDILKKNAEKAVDEGIDKVWDKVKEKFKERGSPQERDASSIPISNNPIARSSTDRDNMPQQARQRRQVKRKLVSNPLEKLSGTDLLAQLLTDYDVRAAINKAWKKILEDSRPEVEEEELIEEPVVPSPTEQQTEQKETPAKPECTLHKVPRAELEVIPQKGPEVEPEGDVDMVDEMMNVIDELDSKSPDMLNAPRSPDAMECLGGIYLEKKWFNGSIKLTPECITFSCRNREEKIEMKNVLKVGDGDKKPEIIIYLGNDEENVLLRTGSKRQVAGFIEDHILGRKI